MTEDSSNPIDPPDLPPSSDTTKARSTTSLPAEDYASMLRRVLLTIYAEMQTYLELELGSRDVAQDALHDTWEKLRRGPQISAVRNPRAYLRRMALNLGRNRLRISARFVGLDIRAIEELSDEASDPERIAAAGNELAAVFDALGELPEQRRAIFFDKFQDGLSLDESARLRGLHRRTIQKELDRATRFLRQRLGRGA